VKGFDGELEEKCRMPWIADSATIKKSATLKRR
jgi:hypothetical protein